MVEIRVLPPADEQYRWQVEEANEILKEAHDAIASRKIRLLKLNERLLILRAEETNEAVPDHAVTN